MNERINQWGFAGLPPARVQRLIQAPPLADIAAAIVQSPVLCAHSEAHRTRPDFARFVVSFDAGESLFDQFFNSLNGYRAAYWHSECDGLRANRCCIDLVAAAAADVAAAREWSLWEESLKGHSAKIWLAECGKETEQSCPQCTGEWHSHGQEKPAEILNGRWEASQHYKGFWGRRAPCLAKIRVFGSFVDTAGNELIPADKRARAHELFMYGWS
jgi:hypothetical protein